MLVQNVATKSTTLMMRDWGLLLGGRGSGDGRDTAAKRERLPARCVIEGVGRLKESLGVNPLGAELQGYLAPKNPPPKDHHRSLGIVLL